MLKQIIVALLILFPIVNYAQKLEEVKIDPVSHLLIKHTSWEKFTKTGQFNSYFRMSQVDSAYFFEIRIILNEPKPMEAKEGEELIFTLSNGEKLTLNCFKGKKSCLGCGAVTIAGNSSPGIELSYHLTKQQLEKLRINQVLTKEEYAQHKKEEIEHIKLNITSGSIEHELSENSYYQIRKSIKLLKK